MYFFYKIKHEC